MFRSVLMFLTAILFLSCLSDRADSDRTQGDGDHGPLFQRLDAKETGIDFNLAGQYMMSGDPTGLYSNISAVAAGDINNDGLPDLIFSGGHENSGLFLNKGNFEFENITRSAGIIDYGEKFYDTEGINMVDINGDGLLDIYILKTGLRGNFKTGDYTRDGANLLFINQGDLTFKEEAAKYGLDIIGLSHTANFFDYDADGDLDVYIAHTAESGASFSFPYYQKPPSSKWLNDQFLENRDGNFVDVRESAGLPFERNIPLSVSVADVNNDGYGDIYVTNDFFGRDFFFLNNRDKTFSDAHGDFFTKTAMSAMGSDFGDINNDGLPDLFVGEMMPPGNKRQKQNLVPFSLDIYDKLNNLEMKQYTRNMLQINHGGQVFRDIGLISGVYATEWSWSAFFIDADLDGWKDLYITNGILRDMTNMDFVKKNFGEDYTLMADPDMKAKAQNYEAPEVVTPNFAYKNVNGFEFEDVSQSWNLKDKTQTRGATYADLDDDGDLDIILNVMDDSPIIYKNLARQQNRGNYLKVKCKAKGQNTFGVGAEVTLSNDGETLYGYISNQRGFQSCPEPVIHFGVGEWENIESMIITWPGGDKEEIRDVKVNQTLTIVQGENKKYTPTTKKATQWLSEVDIPSLNHRENDFQEFKSNRIAIHESSKAGPGICATDIDGNGEADLILSGSSGHPGKVLMNARPGQKAKDLSSILPVNRASEDLGILAFDVDSDGDQDILVCGGHEENGKSIVDQLYINESGSFSPDETFSQMKTSSRFAIARDIDGDDDLDIFLAGRGQEYKASNFLMINEGGSLVNATNEWCPDISETFPLSSAIWTDANGDGQIDLMTVGHWMPVTIWTQNKGKFTPSTVPDSEGWWNSIISADLNNDGYFDYIVGNHGENSIFTASAEEPMTLALTDLDNNGNIDPLVFKYTSGVNAPFVNRDLFTSHMPAYNKKFYNFKAYSEATFDNLITDDKNASVHYAKEMRTGVFMNDGKGNFSFHPLPVEAQLAPVHGIVALDLNRDTELDIILAGNSNYNHYEYGDIDALGIAVFMANRKGSFKYWPQTNLPVEGFPRGISSWSRGDTLFLTVAYNNGPTRTFITGETAERRTGDHGTVRVTPKKSRAWEYCHGSGYLSQSQRVVIKDPE